MRKIRTSIEELETYLIIKISKSLLVVVVHLQMSASNTSDLINKADERLILPRKMAETDFILVRNNIWHTY